MSKRPIEIPNEARQSFSQRGSVPLDVVAELFSRASIPTEVQAAFWSAAMAKELHYMSFKWIRIHTKKDGKVTVVVADGKGGSVSFTYPDEMTKDQLDEFKRAQSHRLGGTIEYQVEGKSKPINEVDVFSEDEKKSDEFI